MGVHDGPEYAPYGQFYRSSSDKKLLSAFGATFLCATVLASLSLIQSQQWAGVMALVLFWGIVLIFTLLLFAFRRALNLINPVFQLSLIVEGVRNSCIWWEKRYQRRKPLIELERVEEHPDTEHDWTRWSFIKQNPTYFGETLTSIRYVISVAKRYWQTGDHDVAGIALESLVNINYHYIQAKKKTFFSANPLLDVGLSTDSVINETLEQLRQLYAAALKSGDEQKIGQIFSTYVLLTEQYLQIDYADSHNGKTHANLSAAYLTRAATDAIQMKSPDVLMGAIGHLSQVVKRYAQEDIYTDSAPVVEAIGRLGLTGSINKDFQPVTQTAMNELSTLTLCMIGMQEDATDALRAINEQVTFIVKVCMNIEENPLSNPHSKLLGNYYGIGSSDSLQQHLSVLTNQLLAYDEKSDRVEVLIRNIARWAEGVRQRDKELFLLALEKNSSLFHDIAHWIDHLSHILMSLSKSESCSEYLKQELLDTAEKLLLIYTWIPRSEEAVRYAEAYSFTETIFDAGFKAFQGSFDDIHSEVIDILGTWAFKAGQYGRGWGSLQSAVAGAAILAVLSEKHEEVQKLEVKVVRLAAETQIDDKVLQSARSQLEAWAKQGPARQYPHSRIERALQQIDKPELNPLLLKLHEAFPDKINEAG
ncbi:MAG: hypothetical protein OQK12_09335 [Motiliproteus sp.]|nr:hypothetical protein [Motiliproteus sp.]MCW9051687.1 hypothetical protein [Motiliproteus sp.]